jgi:BlaI family penicillinase repressor
MMKETEMIKPTESEMEILKILWEKGDSTVREVHDLLSESKSAGYTTTLKLMQIMHDKGLLYRNDETRSHVYSAAVKKESMQKQVVTKMINGMFKGSPAKLIMHALGNHRASKEEIEEIKKYLEEMGNEISPKRKSTSKK